MGKRRSDDRIEHEFTREDREAQLCDLESLCVQIADAFASQADSHTAEMFSARAAGAARLMRDGFTQADLNELGGQFPDGAAWLNPRYLDYNGPREPWQERVAQLHALAKAVAMDLRAVATLYRE